MSNVNEFNNIDKAAVCVPVYNQLNNQKLEIKFVFKTKKCFCLFNKEFELYKNNQQWELSFNENKKYFFDVNNHFQFKSILSNLGVKDKNYIVDIIDIYYRNKKINYYLSDNLSDAIEWTFKTSNDLMSVTRVLY